MGSCLSTNRGDRRRDDNNRRGRRSRSRRRRQSEENVPLDQRLHVPLRRPRWIHNEAKDGPPPSITSLQRQRDDFWFTRVSGRPEIWNTIRSVCEMLMEDDSEPQLATAREMLAAAEITTPTGMFENGAWDNMGNRYKVPRHIVSNPLNVGKASPPRQSSDSQESIDSIKSDMSGGQGGSKAFETIAHTAKFRVQDAGNSWDITIEFWSDEKVKKIIKRIIQKVGLSPDNHKARMVMDGKLFDVKKRLMDPGQPLWNSERIIQVFVRNTDPTDPQSSPSPPIDSRLPVPFPPPPGEAQNAESGQPETEASKPSEENQDPKPSTSEGSKDPNTSEENKSPKQTPKEV
ncbi:hypothetical protein TWF281_008452 [Arthrobotrys megalospora]